MSDEPQEPGGLTVTVSSLPPADAPNPVLDMTVQAATALAYDLAIEMFDRAVILRKHQINEETCKKIEATPYFRKLIEQAAREWNAPTNVRDRLALEAALALEHTLPTLVERMNGNGELLSSVAQTAKVLSDIAGVNKQNQQQQATEKFTITINLGADKQVFDKTITVEAAGGSVEAPGSAGPLQVVGESKADGS